MSETATTTTPDYIILRAWNRYMGAGDGYAQAQVRMAVEEGAPWNAIYRRDDGWHTTDTVTNIRALGFLGIPKDCQRRNIAMQRQRTIESMAADLNAQATGLRGLGDVEHVGSAARMADELERAAAICGDVADRLAILIEAIPRASREQVEPAVRTLHEGLGRP